MYLAKFKSVLKIVTLNTIKAVVVTKINVVTFYFHFKLCCVSSVLLVLHAPFSFGVYNYVLSCNIIRIGTACPP